MSEDGTKELGSAVENLGNTIAKSLNAEEVETRFRTIEQSLENVKGKVDSLERANNPPKEDNIPWKRSNSGKSEWCYNDKFIEVYPDLYAEMKQKNAVWDAPIIQDNFKYWINISDKGNEFINRSVKR